jgi:hypothetical protein
MRRHRISNRRKTDTWDSSTTFTIFEGTSEIQRMLIGRAVAIAANAASTRLSPVLRGASDHIRAAAWTPAWCRTLV